VIALAYSLKSSAKADVKFYDKARLYSRRALFWNILSVVFTIFMLILVRMISDRCDCSALRWIFQAISYLCMVKNSIESINRLDRYSYRSDDVEGIRQAMDIINNKN
jgi:hypothetical protein